MSKVSVCLVSYNSEEYIKELIKNIAEKTSMINEIFIADIVNDGCDIYFYQGIKITRFFCSVPHKGYGHALGLHECIDRANNEYLMLTDPDIHIYLDSFDVFLINLIEYHNIKLIGISHYACSKQCYGVFPTVTNCIVKKSHLPNNDYLKNHLKIRPSIYADSNLDRDDYVICNGKYLLQSPIPDLYKSFPNPKGVFDVGCNLWLYFNSERWLVFTSSKEHIFSTENINNFGLNDDFGDKQLLFHMGYSSKIKFSYFKEKLAETLNFSNESQSTESTCKT